MTEHKQTKVNKPMVWHRCFNCHKLLCDEVSDIEGKGEHYVPSYCDDCMDKDCLNQLFVDKVPIIYDIEVALEENVRTGKMTRKWNNVKKEYEYRFTDKGRQEVEAMIKNNQGKRK